MATLSGVYESSSSPVTYTADSWTVQDATVSVPLFKVTAANAGGFATGNAITFQDGQIIGPCYTQTISTCVQSLAAASFSTVPSVQLAAGRLEEELGYQTRFDVIVATTFR